MADAYFVIEEPPTEKDQLDVEIQWLEQEVQKATDAVSFEKGKLEALKPRLKRAKKRRDDMLNASGGNVSSIPARDPKIKPPPKPNSPDKHA